MRFIVRVPGSTSNLGAGFDTLSAALGIYLRLKIEVTGEEGLKWPDDWDLPPEENMIEAAYTAACRQLTIEAVGLKIEVDNQIPLKRGLGSSGAAIIAGIKTAEHLARQTLTTTQCFDIAYPLERHPDNLSASLLGGWVISTTTGNGMQAERIDSPLDPRFVVAIPEMTVSTATARDILPEHYSLADSVFNLQRSALFVHALHEGRGDLFREASRDRLHQPYRASLVPGMTSLLRREGLPSGLQDRLLSVTISGSGSCTLAIVDSSDSQELDSIGLWMTGTFARMGTAAGFRVLELDRMGAQIE